MCVCDEIMYNNVIFNIDSDLPLSVLASKRLSPQATPKAFPWKS